MASNIRVIKRGPIFDDARRKGLLEQGMRAGTEKLLPRVRRAVTDKLHSTSGIDTGRYLHSIGDKVYASGAGVVRSDDPRKLKTWIETGKRRGVKTARKGSYAWRAGKALARSENKAGYYEAEVAKVLQ